MEHVSTDDVHTERILDILAKTAMAEKPLGPMGVIADLAVYARVHTIGLQND